MKIEGIKAVAPESEVIKLEPPDHYLLVYEKGSVSASAMQSLGIAMSKEGIRCFIVGVEPGFNMKLFRVQQTDGMGVLAPSL